MIILNIFLAAVVVIGIVGLLAWSVATQDRDALVGATPRTLRRRRQAPARASVIARAAQHRA